MATPEEFSRSMGDFVPPVEDATLEMKQLQRDLDVLDRNVRQVTQNLARFSRALLTSTGLGSAVGARQLRDVLSQAQRPAGAAGTTAGTAAVAAQTSAIAANTAVLRTLATVVGAQAAASATRSIATMGSSGGGRGGFGGLQPIGSGPVRNVPLRLIQERTPEEEEKHQQELAERRDKSLKKRMSPFVERGKEMDDFNTLERGKDKPPIELELIDEDQPQKQPEKPETPADRRKRAMMDFDSIEKERMEKSQADFQKRLDKEGVTDPEERAKRTAASNRSLEGHREKRRAEWISTFEQQEASRPVTQEAARPMPDLDPMEMVPGETVPGERKPTTARSAYGGRGKKPPIAPTSAGDAPDGSSAKVDALIKALDENTGATLRNTSAMARTGGMAVGRGGPGGLAPVDTGKRIDDTAVGVGKLSDAFNQLTSGVAAASAGILGMVSIADPSSFSTFTGSLKMLSAEIGGTFAPYVKQAGFFLQDLRDSFRGLSEGTKENIGYVGSWVLGLGLAATAMRTFAWATGVSTAATWAFNRAWRASPIGVITTGVVVLTGALAAAGNAWFNWGKKATDASKDVKNALDQVNKEKGPLQPPPAAVQPIDPKKDFAALPADIRGRLEGAGTGADMKNILTEFQKSVSDEREKLLTNQVQELREMEKGRPAAIQMAKLGTETLQTAHDRAIQDFAARTKTDPGQLTKEGARGPVVDKFLASPEMARFYQLQDEVIKGLAGQARAQGMKPEDVTGMMRIRGFTDRPALSVPEMPTTLPKFAGNLHRLDSVLSNVGGLLTRMGGTGYIEDRKNVPGLSAKYTDAMSYRESVQIAALNKVDTEIDIMRTQLAAMDKAGNLLTVLVNETKLLAEAVKRIPPPMRE